MNKNYRFMPKGKKQNNQFSSVTPSSIVEFQEPKEEKINLIRQSQIPSNNINEEFYNSDLNHLKQVEIVNGKETESDDVIINNQLHENIVDQTDSSRMKYLISQNEIENIDFISTLIRLKGRNNTQTSDRLSIENNVIVKPEDESKSYIKEILDICDNNNNINCNSNGESFSISVNDNTNGTNVMLYRQSANSAQPKTIKGINTKDLIEITNRRKMMKDSMTSVDPYLRRRHLEEVARMEKIKKDLDKKELGSCAFTPQINKRSKLICEKMSSGKYETIDDVPQNNIYSNRASVQNNYTKDIQQLIQEAKDIDNNDTFKHYLTTNKKVNNTKYSNISNQPITTKSTRYDNYNSNGSNVNVNVAPIENLSNIINVSSSGVIPSNYYNNNDEEEFPIETAEQYDYNNNEQNNIPIENRLFYSTEDLEREAQQQQSKPKIKLNLKQIKEEAKRRQQLLEQYQTVIDPNDPNSNISITNSTTLPPKTSSVNTQANTSGNIAMTSPSNQIVTSSSNTRQFYPQGNIKLEIGDHPTNFVPRPYGEELSLCKRYYQELVCMGVTSPKIAIDYKAWTEKRNNSKLVSMNMRSKEKGWFVPHLEEHFANGKMECNTLFGTYIGYGFQVFNRPSCFFCQYRDTTGVGDIRVGDFWGIKETDAFWNSKGVSGIYVRTRKGLEFVDGLKDCDFKLFETDYILATRSNMSSFK